MLSYTTFQRITLPHVEQVSCNASATAQLTLVLHRNGDFAGASTAGLGPMRSSNNGKYKEAIENKIRAPSPSEEHGESSAHGCEVHDENQ